MTTTLDGYTEWISPPPISEFRIEVHPRVNYLLIERLREGMAGIATTVTQGEEPVINSILGIPIVVSPHLDSNCIYMVGRCGSHTMCSSLNLAFTAGFIGSHIMLDTILEMRRTLERRLEKEYTDEVSARASQFMPKHLLPKRGAKVRSIIIEKE